MEQVYFLSLPACILASLYFAPTDKFRLARRVTFSCLAKRK